MKYSKDTQFITNSHYEIDAHPLSDFTDVTNFNPVGLSSEDRMFVVKHKQHVKVSGVFNKEETKEVEGFITGKELNDLVENPHATNLITGGKHTTFLVSKDFLDYFTKYGQYGQLAKLVGNEELNFSKFVSKTPFTEGKSKDKEFIQFAGKHSDEPVWKNTEGKLFMAPFVFDYIGANLDNGNYHMDELIEHLMKRDDVAFLVEVDFRKEKILSCPLHGNEEGVNKIIRNIPYYNADEGRNETINLIYYPKQEDIEKIISWKENKKEHPEIWNRENYIVRVILDCEKFRIKPLKEVEPVVPKRKFKS